MGDDSEPDAASDKAATRGRWPLVGLLVLVVVLIGWGARGDGPFMSIPAPYQADAQTHYCVILADDAQGLSYKQLLIGWLLVCAAALAGVMGGVLGSPGLGGKPFSLNAFLRAYRGVLLLAMATLLTAGGKHFLDRSAAATQAAMTATGGIALIGTRDPEGRSLDRQAYELCVQAKSAWLGGRSDYSRLDELADQMRALGQDQGGAPSPNGAP